MPNIKNKTILQNLNFDYINCPLNILFEKLETTQKGLSSDEAEDRLKIYGLNQPAKKKKRSILLQILSKFINPLVIVLLVIAFFSFFFGEKISALLVSIMAIISVFLSFFQEYKASKEAERLRDMVTAKSDVFRDGKLTEQKIQDLVPGDIVDLSAGDIIPADLRIISCKDLFINQASLTGESFPVEKFVKPQEKANPTLSEFKNIVFMGSSVVSGTGLAVVVKTGVYTQFGDLSKRLININANTNFEKGVNNFTMVMVRIMVILVILIFAINALSKGKMLEAFLFSLGVAVGLTPEMLPMIIAINLSKGAISMSKKRVIVKRLNSIQNLGAMDILCTDKTGTLTLDEIILEKHCDIVRQEDDEVLELAYLNSFYQTGLKNILDKAVLKYRNLEMEHFEKVDEIPFDFSRRIMSVIVDVNGTHKIISKGAPEEIFKRCSKYELDNEIYDLENIIILDLVEEYNHLSSDGFRVLAIAYKNMEKKDAYSKDDECDLILKGYIAFLDPPKPSAREAIVALKKLGVDLKVLTGDNELVTKKVCETLGLDIKNLITGDKVEKATNIELQELVKTTNIFARLSPIQKERVIHALHDNKHVVGFLGDGINDALALKAADVGISVNNAVDIAKESADVILLEKSLMVLDAGVIEGRKAFGNIIKYIKMGASSNFGNMFSMTGASLFLPFLPMLPIQILLNNLLYDISQIAIPTDEVDKDFFEKPRTWDVNYIKKFMFMIGPISSIFDFVTFGILMFVFKSSEKFFHTGWFIESLCTQTLVIFIIRTNKIPFLESKPSSFLVFSSLFIVASGIAITFSPLAKYFGFIPMPPTYFVALFLIILIYLLLVQFVKTWFVRKYDKK